MNNVYLVACAAANVGGGIYQFVLNNAGRLTPRAHFPCDKPMYAVRTGSMLHMLLRYENEAAGVKTGAYLSLSLGEQGAFGVPFGLTPSRGEVPCHLTVLGTDTYLVNYISGNVVKNGRKSVFHAGRGAHAVRQNAAHTHFVSELPDGFLGVCDLGIDVLRIYDRDLKPISEARVPSGCGIRHFVTKKTENGCMIYAVNELVPSISRFDYKNGKATYLDSVMLPCERATSTAAAIRLSEDGKYLYASVRDENILCALEVAEDGTIALVQAVSCEGNGPRDFALCGDHLICTNQLSGTVTVFALKNGRIGKKTDEVTLPDPLCVVV